MRVCRNLIYLIQKWNVFNLIIQYQWTYPPLNINANVWLKMFPIICRPECFTKWPVDTNANNYFNIDILNRHSIPRNSSPTIFGACVRATVHSRRPRMSVRQTIQSISPIIWIVMIPDRTIIGPRSIYSWNALKYPWNAWTSIVLIASISSG